MVIRPLAAADRAALDEALRRCGAFSDEEIVVANEVLDGGLEHGLDGDYPHLVAEVDGRAEGYVCVGKTPMTRGTWHLYWICVHPRAQKLGVGRALQAAAEDFVRARGGERVVLETSGRPDYARTRRFYADAGYAEVGRIVDYYKPGDDCVYFCKAL
ncbi:MAG: GNAT family N-acetyltransferase [Myxococcota bacterium]